MSERRTIVAVFRDGTEPDEGEPLIPYVQNIGWAQWADGNIYLDAVGQDGAAFDITGGAFIFTVKARPTDTDAVISREATILAPGGGSDAAYLPIGSEDVGVSAKSYGYNLIFVDADGKIWSVVPLSTFAVEPSDYIPGQAVTVPVSQDPLAQGPPGANTFRYTVSQPTDGDDFTVSIPAGAQVGSSSYGVNVTLASEVALVAFAAPIADRTATALRIIASAPPTDAAILEVTIYELVA